ncbi:MAG: TROVE domain-containing protein [Bryobacterales bacterium]|nr:TROVE domain-containing protein [Bryobacterales bacterium]
MTMANQTLFATRTRNQAGALAYAMPAKHALAQYAATGCFSRTFYATGEAQLAEVLRLCEQVEPEFVARTAVYSRTRGFMKDMPALLCAWLSKRDARLHEAVFGRVIDNLRMLRNYVQILRSGVVGRRSLGTAPKRLVRQWLESQREESLFRSSAGQSPSLADLVKMVHPKPAGREREAFYGYLLGREHAANRLPELVRQYEAFKAGDRSQTPDVPFTLLSSLSLTGDDWRAVARRASWQTLRMNLNTFLRQGVFTDAALTRRLAERLCDKDEIRKARVFPYQLLAAFQASKGRAPQEISDALQAAMELAVDQVPEVAGRVVVCPDVSGSMLSPVTGGRKGSTTAVRCVDVAALVAAAVLRKNPKAMVLPFEQNVVRVELKPEGRILANAERLAAVGGGGTDCSAPLKVLNRMEAKVDLAIFVSDNESWVDPGRGRSTAMLMQWEKLRKRNPRARLVCLDIQPNRTVQVADRDEVLNVGGFSDAVFELVSLFAGGKLQAWHWVGEIERVRA